MCPLHRLCAAGVLATLLATLLSMPVNTLPLRSDEGDQISHKGIIMALHGPYHAQHPLPTYALHGTTAPRHHACTHARMHACIIPSPCLRTNWTEVN